MNEEEIRPKELFKKYLELSTADGNRLDAKEFVACACQACGSTNAHQTITKGKYSYMTCNECSSLYCSPRPSMAQLDSLYFESESSTFWSNVFFPTVQEVRREKIFKPKAKKLAQMLKDKGLNVKSICDVGAGHGFFLEELRKELPGCEYFAVEPDANSASVCTKKGITTLQATAETAHEWAQKFDLVISSEVLEHVHDVKGFIDSLFALLKKDGHCLITCLGYEGFDILTLQEKSASVTPPHHLNFLSIEGFESVFKRSNFVSTDIWTPGELDVDIVLNSGVENEFLRVLKSRGPVALKEFQQFLVKNKMSSHIWALAKK